VLQSLVGVAVESLLSERRVVQKTLAAKLEEKNDKVNFREFAAQH
jgi:hypothetical protein